MAMSKYLYSLTDQGPDCTPEVLGGKGAHLMDMVKLGVNVPPAVIVPTSLCVAYMNDPKGVHHTVRELIVPAIMQGLTKDGVMPLVSVRSGAPVSMPGMMDTILNVGLCQDNLNEWRSRIGLHCAQDSYKRLGQMYADVVKAALPADPTMQLEGAILAVFESWNNERAKTYRKLHGIPDSMGTAVVVQTMVFGNMNDKSATGVLFTRNPSTGVNELMGDFLINAQGEDVVDGAHLTMPLVELQKWNKDVAQQLMDVASRLEAHYRDMQDIEFTVQDGTLYILQTRRGKRTAQAAVKIAMDLCKEGVLKKEEVLERVTLKEFLTATRPTIAPGFNVPATGRGEGASNGVASGVAVFSAQRAVEVAKSQPVILVTPQTSPDDIAGMHAAKGILTATGGVTSHAAVVARGMNRVCVVGCKELTITPTFPATPGSAVLNGCRISEGQTITLNGATGEVWVGVDVPMVDGTNSPEVAQFLNVLHVVYPYTRVATTAAAVESIGTVFCARGKERSEIHAAVKKMKVGMIDVLPPHQDEEDEAVLTLFATTPISDKAHALTALLEVSLDKEQFISVIGEFSFTQAAALKKGGYKVVNTVNTLEELVLVEKGGFVLASNKVGNEAVVNKVLQLKKAAGEPCYPVRRGVQSKNDFGQGVVLATDMQMLQAVLPR